jgi:large subunit ribosomal protein L11
MGQALGPLGINMNQFCKDFNVRTAFIKSDVPMKATVIAYPDRTFGFFIKPPETSWFLRKCSGLIIFCFKFLYNIKNRKGEIHKLCKAYGF